MSRLDAVIGRLKSQRSCLNAAVALIGEAPGHVLELGLGNGRTYDHLRLLFPNRNIMCLIGKSPRTRTAGRLPTGYFWGPWRIP